MTEEYECCRCGDLVEDPAPENCYSDEVFCDRCMEWMELQAEMMKENKGR